MSQHNQDRCTVCGAKLDSHDQDHLCRMHTDGKFPETCETCGKQKHTVTGEWHWWRKDK